MKLWKADLGSENWTYMVAPSGEKLEGSNVQCFDIISSLDRHADRQTDGQTDSSGVGVRLKVGINIEKIEGVGLCPPQLGVWGLPPPPQKKKALKIMQF